MYTLSKLASALHWLIRWILCKCTESCSCFKRTTNWGHTMFPSSIIKLTAVHCALGFHSIMKVRHKMHWPFHFTMQAHDLLRLQWMAPVWSSWDMSQLHVVHFISAHTEDCDVHMDTAHKHDVAQYRKHPTSVRCKPDFHFDMKRSCNVQWHFSTI